MVASAENSRSLPSLLLSLSLPLSSLSSATISSRILLPSSPIDAFRARVFPTTLGISNRRMSSSDQKSGVSSKLGSSGVIGRLSKKALCLSSSLSSSPRQKNFSQNWKPTSGSSALSRTAPGSSVDGSKSSSTRSVVTYGTAITYSPARKSRLAKTPRKPSVASSALAFEKPISTSSSPSTSSSSNHSSSVLVACCGEWNSESS
mmetsp:Transcript_28339/g.58969  ORF Transcript_28339/g.58969 Transcript_28339/m.58969 type:complete len:204 (+) Transcript_28339:594-1205(+)